MKAFNVIIYNPNRKIFEPYDIIPYLLDAYKESRNKPSNFNEFKDFVNKEAMYQWWSRCEYEIILKDWPSEQVSEKWDIYKQVRMNIDIITQILIDAINEE